MARAIKKNLAWLARRLKITRGRMSQIANDPDWSFGRSGWSNATLVRIDQHIAARRESNNATASDEQVSEAELSSLTSNPEKKARIHLLVERTAKLKLERELLAGGFIKREEVEREQIAKVYSVRAKLQELPLRASLICHKSEAECESILREWMKEICDFYAGS